MFDLVVRALLKLDELEKLIRSRVELPQRRRRLNRSARGGFAAVVNRRRDLLPFRHFRQRRNALELNAADLFIKAGLPVPTELPSLEPYLRTKYNLSSDEAAEAQASIREILARYDKTEDQE